MPVVALLGLVVIGSGAVQIAQHAATREPALFVAVDSRDVALTHQLLERGANPKYRFDGRTSREWVEAYAEDIGVRITYDEMIALFE